MNQHEAFTIATLRIHFGCSHSKLGGLARAIYGPEHCRRMGATHDYGSPLGRELVAIMEHTLGFEPCETDEMVMCEQVCMSCQRTQWAICYPSDTEKQCGFCGEMATLLIPPNDE